jgi:hypothetical protein
MTFNDCVFECAKNNEFIREFNRLTGCNFGQSLKRSPIVIAVDDATGFSGESPEDMGLFVAFVDEFVWSRLIEK